MDGIGFGGSICLSCDVDDAGTAIVEIGWILPPAFVFCQGHGFNPGEVEPPPAGHSVDAVSFVADNLRPLGFGCGVTAAAFFPFGIGDKEVFEGFLVLGKEGGTDDNSAL